MQSCVMFLAFVSLDFIHHIWEGKDFGKAYSFLLFCTMLQRTVVWTPFPWFASFPCARVASVCMEQNVTLQWVSYKPVISAPSSGLYWGKFCLLQAPLLKQCVAGGVVNGPQCFQMYIFAPSFAHPPLHEASSLWNESGGVAGRVWDSWTQEGHLTMFVTCCGIIGTVIFSATYSFKSWTGSPLSKKAFLFVS